MSGLLGARLRSVTAIAAISAAISISLSGCFDLSQRVAIDRHGAGQYRASIAAQGIVGEALKEKPAELGLGHDAHAATRTVERDGRVTQTTIVDFRRLSDLKLPDELVSLHVLGHSFFGLGPTHVRFRRTFLVANARNDHENRMGRTGGAGSQIMASVFGDHTYVFAVTLPGSILKVAPVRLGQTLVVPTVTGDFYHGHTVTWTMPLYRVLSAKMLTFEVDFSAWGSFADAESIPEGAATAM